jgi:IclR family acetate operon transcriptional repressor
VPRTGSPATRHLAAVERATRVLDALADAGRDVGTNELARTTGINASTVSRLLATLHAGGYVEHVADTGRYRLGPRLLRLGAAALARVDVRAVARPWLDRLVELTGETATLSLPGEAEAITIDFVLGHSSVVSVARVGRPSVAHATAVGKVMLAFGPRGPDALDSAALVRFTPGTIVERDALACEVDAVREQGYAMATAEREPDLAAMAAPARDRHGRLVAILGVQGPLGRFDAAARQAALPELVHAAAAVGGSV